MTWLRDRRFRRVLLTLLTVAYVGFIYGNSLQNGADSSERSGRVVELLQWLLSSLGWTGEVSEHFIRKLAHFAEYAGLGVLLGITLRTYTPRLFPYLFVPLFAGLAVPVSDEFLQLFVEGRAGMVQDVVLDFAGMLAGLSLTVLLLALAGRVRRRGRKHVVLPDEGKGTR